MRRAIILPKIEVLYTESPMGRSEHAMDVLRRDQDARVELPVGGVACES